MRPGERSSSRRGRDEPPRVSERAPGRVLLFSGHMIDAPDRATPRFPPEAEPAVRAAIARTLDGLAPGPADLAICGGACGGDLLFAEAVLARGVRLELHLPFDEPSFLRRSVEFADASWGARYRAVRRHPRTALLVAADVLGPLPAGADPHERNNVWMLESALRSAAGKIEFICLWNGEGGDGPGGTQHMMREVEAHAGRVHWLDIRALSPPR